MQIKIGRENKMCQKYIWTINDYKVGLLRLEQIKCVERDAWTFSNYEAAMLLIV